jgi:hypothetical protein
MFLLRRNDRSDHPAEQGETMLHSAANSIKSQEENTMKTINLIGSVLGLAVVALSGCGGGTGTPSSATTKISGMAAKGPINGGTVKVFAVRNGTEDRTAPIGQGQTDANGNYTVDVGAYKGPVMVEVTGGSFTDEVAGVPVSLKTSFSLRAVFANASTGTKTVAVTPLTELACKKAKIGQLTRTTIDDANTKMAAKFKLADIVSTLPVAGGASDDQKKYAAACGSISQLVNTSKQAGESLDDALPRVLGEMETEIEQSGDLSNDSTTKLNTAMDDFNKSGKNKTGGIATPIATPASGEAL